ncbi:hypothetical protein EVAR_72376_1 [Eumeta japonica]|uniref:Rho-GAP domain-containing protein n=1 Tax=Eumeta variegata TaxID=151549 RepID=A0A4C1T1M1_EUMVA|nr:hypothetical protein EVAR_72376_1 [Eumeta japonica]
MQQQFNSSHQHLPQTPDSAGILIANAGSAANERRGQKNIMNCFRDRTPSYTRSNSNLARVNDEPCFDTEIELVLKDEIHKTVPKIVVDCCQLIEDKYRKSTEPVEVTMPLPVLTDLPSKLEILRRLIRSLPEVNRDTMEFLFAHFNKLTKVPLQHISAETLSLSVTPSIFHTVQAGARIQDIHLLLKERKF